MEKTVVHIISHSHLDREWYLSFEEHRLRLVRLFDETMELFEKDPQFRSFHLDGQTIAIDDYLEIRPQKEQEVRRFVEEGRFSAGPWYVLQDEFFTDGESNVRNLLVGMKEAEKFGEVCRIGYFPDSFGHAGQMPQLLKQAGMSAAVFGRGVRPVGFNNQVMEEAVSEGGSYDTKYSEMLWASPDGSVIPGIFFANWYNNAVEIPTEEEAARQWWEESLAKAKTFAGTHQLLFMNGCDHQPVQKDLARALAVARKLFPEVEFIHTTFPAYVDALNRELKEREEREGQILSTVTGELTSQETDGLWTLVNTASARIDLKIRNRECETALTGRAEPLNAMSRLAGYRKDDGDMLEYSWKMLMQNHPHDSICGCSIDAVNREMETRFDKSIEAAEALAQEYQRFLVNRVDVSGLAGKEDRPFLVLNTAGKEKTEVLSVTLDTERIWGRNLEECYRKAEELELPSYVLVNSDGKEVLADIRDAGTGFGYTLPDDRFRQVYMARRVNVTFEAAAPALGYAVYVLKKTDAPVCRAAQSSLATEKNCMENQRLRVEIADDGTYTITDKRNGRSYPSLGYYEDCGDIGNEYIFVQAKKSGTRTTRGGCAGIALTEDTPQRAVYTVTQSMQVPRSADALLEQERRRMVNVHERNAGRLEELTELEIITQLTLEKSACALKVKVTVNNTAEDHRLRIILPTGVRSEHHYTDSVFEVVKRPNRHGRKWKNPSACEHQQNFTALEDENGGLLAANFGLYEYEILPEENNAIALTLLRCVGEMGDWGVFPTPQAQLPGIRTMEYAVVPFESGRRTEAYLQGHLFQHHLSAVQSYTGSIDYVPEDAPAGFTTERAAALAPFLPAKNSFFSYEGEGIHLTAFKLGRSGDIFVRFVNETDTGRQLMIHGQKWMKALYRSNVIEERGESLLPEADGTCRLSLRPFEIMTVGVVIHGQT